MPVVVTFDITQAEDNDYNRIQSMFERLGWQSLGGSAYRYPRLGTADQPVEDWLNHVVPALMMFRAYCVKRGNLKKFTLDVQSSAGLDPESSFGQPPHQADSASFKWYEPSNPQFGHGNLKSWLDGIVFPY